MAAVTSSRLTPWNIFWLLVAASYFLVPLWGTVEFSLETSPGQYGFDNYKQILLDPTFKDNFLLSLKLAAETVVVSVILMVPTAYWVHLKLPTFKPVMDLVAVLPFVVPPITLAVGVLHVFNRPGLSWLLADEKILALTYVMLALPFTYRSLDAGMRSINLQTLTEAAQSVGAGWLAILFRIVLPNIRFALLSAIFLTATLVLGEYTIASLMLFNTFPVYIQYVGATQAQPAAALSMISFGLTWLAMLGILVLGRGVGRRQTTIGGAR